MSWLSAFRARKPIPRWVSAAVLAVAVILAVSLLIDPTRFTTIRARIALRGVPARLFRGCQVVEVKRNEYRRLSFWQELRGLRSLTVSLVDWRHSNLGVVYRIPKVGVYAGKGKCEVGVQGWGKLDEPVDSIIQKLEANGMISEFIQATGAREATFDNTGVVFSRGEYELVYARPDIHALGEERGLYSYRIPNREYTSFAGAIELQRKAEEIGFTIPNGATVVYGRYGGSFVKWNPQGCGDDTLVIHKAPKGEPNIRWISCPEKIDPSLIEPSIRARLAQMGLTPQYVLSNFHLLEKKAVRWAHYERENGKVIDRTKVIGRFTYQWITGTPWVDTLGGGCKVHVFFACRVDRPDSLYLRVGPSLLESSTHPTLHSIGRLISYETALGKLPQFAEHKERFFIKMYPNGNNIGKGMVFLSSGHGGRYVRYVEIDLETGEVNRGISGGSPLIPDEMAQFRAIK